jgi:hypothetical protein
VQRADGLPGAEAAVLGADRGDGIGSERQAQRRLRRVDCGEDRGGVSATG